MNVSRAPFTELLVAIVDNRGRTCPTAAHGIPLIATNCVKNDGLYPTYDKIRHVDQETYDNWFRGHPEPGDILFVCKGSPGQVALVPSPVDFCIAQDMVAVRADPAKIYPGYLFAVLRSPDVQAQIASMHVGTMIPHFKKGDFDKLLIPRLGSDAQRSIGDLYVELSRKIESNRQLTTTIDELIRVELSFVSSDEWPEVSVSSLARFVNGGAYTNGASGTGRMVIRIAELKNGPGGSTVYNELDAPEERVARPGDVLMSWSGSLGVFRWVRSEAIINQHIFKVICERYPPWLVYTKLDEVMPEFQQIAADKATTMGHIKRHHLDDCKVRVPLEGALRKLDEALGPLWQRLVAAEVEALTVEALRDALLPELLSGRLRVKDAEKVAEEVT